ncbi:MAG: TatD family hydrolase, partial [Gammaproteobacteria bacterium]|nr:TatD family hydrolase [Gammaproteobacteria bacterium]
ADNIDIKSVRKIIEDGISNSNNKIVGIGETGLDFYYDISKERQIECFELHLELACLFKLPVIIHMRDAEKEMISIIKKYRDKLKNVLIHCFTGSDEFAEECIKLDCYYSLSGIITFKNAENLRQTIKKLPLERIIFETDSPYLTPVPFRGKINEPKYLKYIIDNYSEIMNLEKDKIEKISTRNYKNLFQIFNIND